MFLTGGGGDEEERNEMIGRVEVGKASGVEADRITLIGRAEDQPRRGLR